MRRLAILLVLGAAACGASDAEPNADGAVETWMLAPEPALRLGAIDDGSAEVFGSVSGAVRLSDGRIVVLDTQSRELRFFDAEGTHIATHGREGEGPGEFRSPSWVGTTTGDTLQVWDRILRRMSTLDPSGAYLASTRLDVPGRIFQPQVLGITHDGTIALSSRILPMPGGLPDTEVLFSAGADGSVSEIGKGHRPDLLSIGEQPRMILPRPFGRSWLAAAGAGGIVYGSNERYELHVHGGGDIRRGEEPTPVTADMVARLKEHTLASAPDENWRDGWERAFDHDPLPTVPAFSALEMDDLGRVWVRRYEWPWLPTAAWDVFTPEGTHLAEVELPADLIIYQIGEDFILAKVEDELDVDYVVLHELRTGTTLADDGGA